MSKKELTEQEKLEKLYSIYTYSFDKFIKFSNKKDNNLQTIKEINTLLKTPSQNFSNFNQIKKYSLILVEPFEKCTTKGMEVILSSMEEILKYNLVSPNILQKMVQKLIAYIHKYFQFSEIDFQVDSEIIKINYIY